MSLIFTIKNGDMILLMLKVKLVIEKGLLIFIFQRIKFSQKSKLTQESSIIKLKMRRKLRRKGKGISIDQNRQLSNKN